MLWDRVPKATKSISRALHLPAKLAHGQVALLKRAELVDKVQGASLGVPQKLGLESKPGLTCGATRSSHDILRI
jgi:hypothetical protein